MKRSVKTIKNAADDKDIEFQCDNPNSLYTLPKKLLAMLEKRMTETKKVKEKSDNEENFVLATIFVAGTAPFVCFPSICIWALFGSSIKLIIKNTKIKKIIEYLLALLLVVTAVIIVVD